MVELGLLGFLVIFVKVHFQNIPGRWDISAKTSED